MKSRKGNLFQSIIVSAFAPETDGIDTAQMFQQRDSPGGKIFRASCRKADRKLQNEGNACF